MPIELKMLAWSVALGLVHVLLGAALITRQRGLGWNVGARDATLPPPTGVAARVDRALRNFLETFPFFAAAALAVVVLERGDATTALGAQCYFWARLAYVPVYAAGIPYLRTLIWGVSLWGLLQLLWALL
ncbi:MAPEG family protein [Pseudoxanthomonas sp. LH2527]|uniref:MAPEG family protein n=1 Tax=Pseudoxanthomonas sp. LH2527 TaxID=2923249 RepID=UPI001F1460D3|nr:MAPEG family protein [Pseudoxanthomonas sp. LH2527]MCH6484834.1 MAPEG family protein [Pseudoxanthomonas sp. LH2527]